MGIDPAEIDLSALRTCNTCGQEKTLADFYRDKSNWAGRSYRCKPCAKAVTRAWKQAHADRAQQHNEARRGKHGRDYYARYRISIEDSQQMRVEQDGKCLICGVADRRLVVDHCHKSKRVRGLLCHRCNVGIGYFKDDPDRLLAAATYLLRDVEVIHAD